MKLLPLSSLSKTPETGAYALSSPSRTTLLLVAKESVDRISHDSIEKKDSLSLKIKFESHWIFFSFPSPLRFPFSFSYFISHLLFFLFLLISPHFLLSLCLSLLLFGALYVWDKNEEISSSPSSNQICGSPFSIIFFYFIIPLFITSSLGVLMMRVELEFS